MPRRRKLHNAIEWSLNDWSICDRYTVVVQQHSAWIDFRCFTYFNSIVLQMEETRNSCFFVCFWIRFCLMAQISSAGRTVSNIYTTCISWRWWSTIVIDRVYLPTWQKIAPWIDLNFLFFLNLWLALWPVVRESIQLYHCLDDSFLFSKFLFSTLSFCKLYYLRFSFDFNDVNSFSK